MPAITPSRPVLPFLAGLVGAATIVVAVWFVIVSEDKRQGLSERLDVMREMTAELVKLEGALTSRLSLMQSVGSYVSLRKEIDQETFQSFLDGFIANDRLIQSVLLIKGTVVVDAYPMKGNEKFIGVALADIDESRETTLSVIKTKDSFSACPIELDQGEFGIMIRVPIFLTPEASPFGSGEYWGQTCLVIRGEALLKESGILESLSSLKYAVRTQESVGDDGAVFWGDEAVFHSNPVVLDLKLPKIVWQIASIPETGWGSETAWKLWYWGVGGVWSILVGLIIYSLLMTQHKFQQRLNLQWSLRRKAQENETKYRTIFESSNDAIFIMEGEKFIDCNTASLQIFGCARHQMVGKLFSAFSPKVQPDGKDSRSKADEKIAAALAGHRQFFEWRHCRYDGTPFDAEVGLNSMEIQGKRILQATVRDITDRKRAEDEIRKSVSLLRSTLESTADGILVVDRHEKISVSNKRFSDLYGIPQYVIDSSDHNKVCEFLSDQLVNPGDFVNMLKESNSEPQTESFDTLEFKDGRVFERYSRPQLITNEVVGRVWSFRDVTARSAAERALREAKDELESRVVERTIKLMTANQELEVEIAERSRADQELKTSHKRLELALAEASRFRAHAEAASSAKSEFLANMSHELRSPLTAVIGFSDLLGDQLFGKLNEKQAGYVTEISEAGHHLLSLINDILDLAKVESRKIELRLADVDLTELLDHCRVMIREMAAKKNLSFDINVSEDLKNKLILADDVRLKQMVINLLSNAVKFTPSGGSIWLEAIIRGKDIIISVSDTGIGLKAEDQERIFDAFEQLESSFTKQEKGTGLGLALVRNLVELHGGSISVESAGEGMGSTFRLTLPCIEGEKDLDSQAPMEPPDFTLGTLAELSVPDKNRHRILVVEDNESNMKVVTDLLVAFGHDVIESFSAEDGIKRAELDRPSLIIMDISLPSMDGLTATRILKSNPVTAHIPVIAMTAHAMKDYHDKAREAGCESFILKPINVMIFWKTLSELLGAEDSDSDA